MVQPYRTSSTSSVTEAPRYGVCLCLRVVFVGTEPLYLQHARKFSVCRVVVHLFGVVQAPRTSSNLHEPQHHRASKVCRGLSQEFGVVRLYRTFSLYIVTGETRSAGCFCTRSGWFKHIEPHRTYSNHNSTEIVRCGEVCHMSSGWFDFTEPSLRTALQGKQGVPGAYAKVRGGSSTSNLIEPTRTTTSQRESKVWRSLSHEFGVVRLYRTFSNYIDAGETRCAWCFCPSSGWFKHIEPLHYRDSKVWRVLTHEFGVVRPYRHFSMNSVKGETRCAGC